MSVAKYGDTLSTRADDRRPARRRGVRRPVRQRAQRHRHRARDLLATCASPCRRTALRPVPRYLGSNVEIMEVATGRRRIVYHARQLDSGAELDARRQGADLEPGRQALSLRPRDRHAHADQHGVADAQQQRPRAVVGREVARHQRSDAREDEPVDGVHCAERGRHADAHHGPVPVVPHGWSPDEKYLIYTGIRDTKIDIYRISVGGGDRDQAHAARGDERRVRVRARRSHLLQLDAQRHDAALAHERGRQRPDPAHRRHLQQLVPARLAGRADDRLHRLPADITPTIIRGTST